jgi:NADP-dependent aldehyde dehydrogenase
MFADLVREGSWVDATIDTADPNRAPAPKPDLRRMLRPRGPVVVFGASNFPFAFSVCGGDTASALAAGCPVVVKGHPSHPGTSELFAHAVLDALRDLSLPLGIFAMLQGRSPQISAALVKHPSTAAVGFTGSTRVGRILFDLAAARAAPIPVYAEMGSLNPLVVLPSALAENSEAIAKGLAGSALLGGGQFCTKPGLIFVVGDENRAFVDALAKQIAATARVTMLNKSLRDSFESRAREFSHIPGVKPVVATQPSAHAGASPALFETTCEVWMREPKLREEAFGPGTLVVRCRGVREAASGVRAVGGSLTGTVHVGEREDAIAIKTVISALEEISGRVIVNGYPTGVEVNHAIVHGGPYPATTDPGTTSVGTAAIHRFTRLIAYQDAPQSILPPELKDENPLKILRRINGALAHDVIPPIMGAAR